MELEETVKLVCQEGKLKDLLSDLAMHRLDVVLANSRLTPDTNVLAFNHFLGQCDVTVFGTPEMAQRYQPCFPRSLDGAPMLLPMRWRVSIRCKRSGGFQRSPSVFMPSRSSVV